jgi:phospholipid/cholesterol/gamma-HCH transport system substrate-binding protein
VSRTGTLRGRLARALALALAGAVALTGCEFSVYKLPLPGGADLGDDPYRVKVHFQDVLDLVPQSAVKVDDVTVGRVDEIELDGYTAVVTVLVHKDIELPDNAVAKIRQTSLLGEKFVSLAPPPSGGKGRLGDGDQIPLERSGRNPEVEEVLGALSLLLNGGGVAQLKTISTELSKALEGREADVKSVLDQLDTFMSQIDENKDAIVQAIESLNRLAVSLNRQEGAITGALDELPSALASIDRQRDDLVRMLQALNKLSDVGTRVIRDSKAATIESLESLAPTLTKLAEAGDSLPKSLQVFLTYPFVDAVVGTDPQQARNLHMGDYTNLSIQMDVDLTGTQDGGILDPGQVCENLPELGVRLCDQALERAQQCLADIADGGQVSDCSRRLVDLFCIQTPGNPLCDETGPVEETLTRLERCLRSQDPDSRACRGVNLQQVCDRPRYKDTLTCRLFGDLPPVLGGGDGEGGGGGGLPDLPDLPGLGGDGGLFRPGFGSEPQRGNGVSTSGYDHELGPLLVWGMMPR